MTAVVAVHSDNTISIYRQYIHQNNSGHDDSGNQATLPSAVPYTNCQACPSTFLSKCQWGIQVLMCGSLSPTSPQSQTASRFVGPFIVDTRSCPADTHRRHYLVCSHRPHLASAAVQSKMCNNTTAFQ